jgi:hypothetical protein
LFAIWATQSNDRIWPMLLKKWRRGVSDPLAKKSTSPIGVQTTSESAIRTT